MSLGLTNLGMSGLLRPYALSKINFLSSGLIGLPSMSLNFRFLLMLLPFLVDLPIFVGFDRDLEAVALTAVATVFEVDTTSGFIVGGALFVSRVGVGVDDSNSGAVWLVTTSMSMTSISVLVKLAVDGVVLVDGGSVGGRPRLLTPLLVDESSFCRFDGGV